MKPRLAGFVASITILLLIVPLAVAQSLELSDADLAEFKTYIEDSRAFYHAPGTAVVVVQGNEIIFAEGFGVKELGGDDPVTPDTLFSIGSLGKAMTSTMLASLVDEGLISWDTAFIDLIPEFQLADADATNAVTLRHALSHSTGLPGVDILLFGNGFSLEESLAFFADIPLQAAPGTAYEYENQMYSAAGHLGAIAAGASYGNDEVETYIALMQERVLEPIGMTRATYSPLEATSDPDHATPHFGSLNESIVETGVTVTPMGYWDIGSDAPSGGVRASALDMGRYLMTMLSGGIAPNGTRIISQEALAETWTPQIAKNPDPFLEEQAYGFGWNIASYQGVEVVTHNGNLGGFMTTMAFLPEADAGIVVLTNVDLLGTAHVRNVQYRFIELLYGLEPRIDGFAEAEFEQIAGIGEMVSQLSAVDPAVVASFLGAYEAPGSPFTVTLVDGRLWLGHGMIDYVELLAAPDGSYVAISGGEFLLQPFQFIEENGLLSLSIAGQLSFPKQD